MNPAPDELLDDWMISGPATEPTSSDYTYFLDRFFGTLAPFLRASERPIAIACFLLLTFLPDLPLLSVPALPSSWLGRLSSPRPWSISSSLSSLPLH